MAKKEQGIQSQLLLCRAAAQCELASAGLCLLQYGLCCLTASVLCPALLHRQVLFAEGFREVFFFNGKVTVCLNNMFSRTPDAHVIV